MKIFDFFGKKDTKKQINSKALEYLQEAQAAYDKGEFQPALSRLSRGFQEDVDYKALYELAAECLEKLDAQEEKTLFIDALAAFERAEPFKNLGNHFMQYSYYGMARAFLEKATRLDPSDRELNHDIAITYARDFQIKRAIEVLEQEQEVGDFWDIWFLSKLNIMADKPDGIERTLNDLSGVLDAAHNEDEVAFARQKVSEVQEMLTKYQRFGQPKYHIRDWHFIQYGGVILDFFDDSEEFVAGGRYVALWGSNEQVKRVAQKLKDFLDKAAVDIQKVQYLDDRGASILGLVIAKELGVAAEIYEPETSAENCLVVATHGSHYESEIFSNIRNGEILFALNHCWLESANISPDIVGFMSQTYYLPWEDGHMRLTEDGKMEQLPADERKPSEIANDIFNETPEDMQENDFDFHLKRKDYLKGIGTKTNKYRYNFAIESPVAGARFG